MFPLPYFALCLVLRTSWSAVSVAFPMLRKYKTPYNSINHLSKNSAKLHHSHHPHNPTFVVIPIPTFRYFPLSVSPLSLVLLVYLDCLDSLYHLVYLYPLFRLSPCPRSVPAAGLPSPPFII